MPTYVAFLRAINLGPTRKFPKADVVSAVESAGASDVVTHGNTGNVRLTTALRSRTRVEQALERAFATDRGFDVPTIVFTPAELVGIAEDAAAIGDGHDGQQYVSLLKQEPDVSGREAIEVAGGPRERAVVRGRAVHLLLGVDYHTATLSNADVERHLGVATNRNVTVIRTLADKWGG
jgi:uncharacterized protein (DUF1697 family)